MQNENEILIKIALDTWCSRINQTNELISSLSDDQLNQEISPNRNRGIYVLGHLTAMHDNMLPLLGFGAPIFPSLKETFLVKADRTVADIPSAEELRQSWNNVNIQITKLFKQMSEETWFEKHTSVSDEDFITQPTRNKLSILISRTNHLSYHFGQLILLKEKEVHADA
ncbi:hypothetical protein Dfri01_46710 [Dyadobacter frigoris]|uniref:DinB family protein n=1 Tax=Dyadobacter frigoris TaxID=2576211 RepID=UPI0024A2AC5A|nr:DinB family protein [Dyadobacter frigoris]GLU55210.1 hypothetical protein Dfri01_46710 [Dyadobacter frigoris]